MNRLSITTRAVALAIAVLVGLWLPESSADAPARWLQPHDGAPVAAQLTVAAACLAVELATEALRKPAAEAGAASPRARPALMPFYSFASSSARTQES